MYTFSKFLLENRNLKSDLEILKNGLINDPDLAENIALLECSIEFEFYFEDLNFKFETNDKETLTEKLTRSYQRLSDIISGFTHIQPTKKKKSFKLPSGGIEISPHYHGINPNSNETNSEYSEKKLKLPNHWFIEYDSSLTNLDYGKVPVEVISPWFPATFINRFIRNFKTKVFDRVGGETDETTGMHISFKTKNSSGSRLPISPIKLLLLINQNELLKLFNREGHFYTKLVDILPFLKNSSGVWGTEEVTNLEKEFLDSVLKRKTNYLFSGRVTNPHYDSISFKDYNPNESNWRIEVRAIGNDYFGKYYPETLDAVNDLVDKFSLSIDTTEHKEDMESIIKDKMLEIPMRDLYFNILDNLKRSEDFLKNNANKYNNIMTGSLNNILNKSFTTHEDDENFDFILKYAILNPDWRPEFEQQILDCPAGTTIYVEYVKEIMINYLRKGLYTTSFPRKLETKIAELYLNSNSEEFGYLIIDYLMVYFLEYGKIPEWSRSSIFEHSLMHSKNKHRFRQSLDYYLYYIYNNKHVSNKEWPELKNEIIEFLKGYILTGKLIFETEDIQSIYLTRTFKLLGVSKEFESLFGAELSAKIIKSGSTKVKERALEVLTIYIDQIKNPTDRKRVEILLSNLK